MRRWKFNGREGDRLSMSFDAGQHTPRAPREAVLVLGMHRSGTSSVAGALVSLGGSAPFHLLPPQPDNEKGFWESSVLVTLNDEVLGAGGSNWRDWREFKVERIDSNAAVALHASAKIALASEFRDADVPIIKDPRMCRLMRFWIPVFKEVEWSVRAVLPLRSPLEVAWSLSRRDGFSLSWACLLWLRHVLDAEAETRAMPRAVLDWSRFLGDKREALARLTLQLGLIWPNGRERALADVDELVLPDLRHHKATEADLGAHPAIGDLVRETYSTMLELIEDPRNNSVFARLDELRARFEVRSGDFWSSHAGVGGRPPQRTVARGGSVRLRAKYPHGSTCRRARRSRAGLWATRCACRRTRCALRRTRCALCRTKQICPPTLSREERERCCCAAHS